MKKCLKIRNLLGVAITAMVVGLSTPALPAHAEFVEAAPQVTFSGVVQGINQQTVAVATPSGVVLVPATQSVFMANGVTCDPFILPVGTPVQVAMPSSAAPELALADLGPSTVATAAFPGSFDSFLVTTDAPPVYAPIPPQFVEPAVAYVPQTDQPLPVPVAAAPGAVVAGYQGPVAPVSVIPATPVYSTGYNAFAPPAWAAAYVTDTAWYGAPPPVVYPAAAFGYTPYPMVPAAYAPYPVYPAYPAFPAFGTGVGVGINLGDVQLGYSSYQPAFGYGVGFAPPFVPYPAFGYAGPYGGSATTISLSGEGAALSFSSFSPAFPFGYPAYPIGYPAYPIGYPMYGGAYAGVGLNFGGVSLGFSSFSPVGYGAFGYPYGGFLAPASVTTVAVGGLAFNFVSQPAYPWMGPVAPFGIVPVGYAPCPAPFAYPMLGPVVGFQPNAVLVQSPNGFVSVPMAALPGSVMSQMVFVRDPRGVVSQVPFQTAMLMHRQGATLVSDPMVPSTALLSRVALMHGSGRVTNVPLMDALHTHGGVILGAAGATSLHHVNPADFRHQGGTFGLQRPAMAAHQFADPRLVQHSPFLSRASGVAVAPPFHGGRVSSGPAFHGGRVSSGPAFHGGHVSSGPAFHGGRVSSGPAFHGGRVSSGPAFHGGHVSSGPAFHGGHVSSGPAFHGGHVSSGPAFHGAARPTFHPASHPAFHAAARPAPAFHAAPRPAFHSAPRPVFHAAPQFNRPVFRPAPAPHFNPAPRFNPAPAMRAPAPPMRAPGPPMRGPEPRR